MAKRNKPKYKTTNKKLTSNRAEWEHQVKLLKRRIKSTQKYMAVDFEYPIPQPKNPKRITKADIQSLKTIKRSQIQTYFDVKLEETVPPHISDVEIENFWQEISKYTGGRVDELINWIENFHDNERTEELKRIQDKAKSALIAAIALEVSKIGKEAFAARMQEHTEHGMFTHSVLYASKDEQIAENMPATLNSIFNRYVSLSELKEYEVVYKDSYTPY